MLTVVVTINLLLALLCLYGAKQIWQFRRALAQASEALIAAEKSTHQVLHGAPQAIIRGQIGTRQLRANYQQLEPKLNRARQAIALLSFSQAFWQRQRVTKALRHKLSKRSALKRL